MNASDTGRARRVLAVRQVWPGYRAVANLLTSTSHLSMAAANDGMEAEEYGSEERPKL